MASLFDKTVNELFQTAKNYNDTLTTFTHAKNKTQCRKVLGENLYNLCFTYLEKNKENAGTFLDKLNILEQANPLEQADPIALLSKISDLYASQMPVLKTDFFPCAFVNDTWNSYCLNAQKDSKKRKLLSQEIACPTGPGSLKAEMASVLAMPFQRPIRMKMLLETLIANAKKTKGPFETQKGIDAIQQAQTVLDNIVSPAVLEINGISKRYSKEDPKGLRTIIEKTKAKVVFPGKHINLEAFGKTLEERGFKIHFDAKEKVLFIKSSGQNIENFGLEYFDLIKAKQLKNGQIIFSVIHPKERTFTTLSAEDVFFELAKMAKIFQATNNNLKFQTKCAKKNQSYLTKAFRQCEDISKMKEELVTENLALNQMKNTFQELNELYFMLQHTPIAKLHILNKAVIDLENRFKGLKKADTLKLNVLMDENCKAAFDCQALIQKVEGKRAKLEKKISTLASTVAKALKRSEKPIVPPRLSKELLESIRKELQEDNCLLTEKVGSQAAPTSTRKHHAFSPTCHFDFGKVKKKARLSESPKIAQNPRQSRSRSL